MIDSIVRNSESAKYDPTGIEANKHKKEHPYVKENGVLGYPDTICSIVLHIAYSPELSPDPAYT